MKKAVVLLSGGLDSATTLYLAKKQGYQCHCLVFDYGQRHKRELESARAITKKSGSQLSMIRFTLPWKGTALVDKAKSLPQGRSLRAIGKGIPSTYVPGRNIIFLSFALSWAEVIHASAIFIGAHAQDFSGYPDCREDFFKAYEKVVQKGTKAGIQGKNIAIITPLLHKSKAEIISLGKKLGVPFELTWSCYKGGKIPCKKCDSCILRAKGFKEANLQDPLFMR